MNIILQHSKNLNIAQQIASQTPCDIEQCATHIRLHFKHDSKVSAGASLEAWRAQYQCDFNALPKFDFSQVGLFVSDMDSTLINIECIDEIADFAQLKPQVAAITRRAMDGELDFKASLIERVALLKGLDVAVLNKVYTQRLQPNLGAGELIQFFKKKSIKSAVVSGGFTYFTQRLAQDLGLDDARANGLKMVDNRLSGTTDGAIIDAQAKADFVQELCQKYGISVAQVVVAGDGANDLLMMNVAGFSVAYHASAQVVARADVAINFGGLDKIMDFFLMTNVN